MKKESYMFNIRDITEIGIFVALAILLDTFVKIPIFADGGSINVAIIPLIFISLHKGWFKGFIASAIIFGLVTCLIDGYGIHTYPFDYLIGYGGVAVVGAFKDRIIPQEKAKFINYFNFVIAILISFAIRVIGSTISGMVFYGLTVVPSLAYQLTYMVPSFTATILIVVPLLNTLKVSFDRLK